MRIWQHSREIELGATLSLAGAFLPEIDSREAGDRALRRLTAQAHGDLDSRVGALDLAHRRDYRQFLRIMEQGFGASEAWIAANRRLLPDGAVAVRRSGLIRDDLALLGEAPGDAGAPLALAAGEPEMLGVLYTLEGSRLGARVLIERVGAGLPRAFLADGAAMLGWPALRGLLRDLDGEALARAVAAALAVFLCFREAVDASEERGAAGGRG